MSTSLALEFPVRMVIDTSSEMTSVLIRELLLAIQVIDTASELMTSLIRERLMSVEKDTSTDLSVKLAYTHVDQLHFTGELKPSDRLVIDTKKRTVTLNGENAIHLVDGDFFNLILGGNTFTYTDSESERNLLTRITYRDKYLY